MHETRALRVLEALLADVGWHEAPLERLEIIDSGIALSTDWPVTANAVAALAAVGLAASALHERRSGQRRRVRIDTRQAGLAMASSTYLTVNGENAKFRDPFTGFYEATNGEWVFLHGNFPHLQAGLLALLGVKTPEDVAAAVRRRDAVALEQGAIDAGLCAALVRTRAQWEAHAQAESLKPVPLVSIERLGDAPPRASRQAMQPLRVLDFSRVIAGPMAGRTLAEHGADVLLVSGPGLPSITSLVIDTGFGKRAAEIDLRSTAGRSLALALAAEAEIVLDAYRPGALAGLGLGPGDFVANTPGLVHVDLDAFGPAGPFAGRRGYDSLVQASVGMCRIAAEPPANLPCQPLDYLTGYLAAFGAMLARMRQEDHGGSWSVRLSLARTAAWMWQTYDDLGPEPGRPARNPTAGEVGEFLDHYDTGFGDVAAIRPPLQAGDWRWSRPPVPLGTHSPTWS